MKFFRARKMANLKLNVEGFEKPFYCQMANKTFTQLMNAKKNNPNEELRIHLGYYVFVIIEQTGSFEFTCRKI